jgi:hypothetical protein
MLLRLVYRSAQEGWGKEDTYLKVGLRLGSECIGSEYVSDIKGKKLIR